MEEPQNNPEQKDREDEAAPAKGAAKVIRAGGEAKTGPSLLRGAPGNGSDQAPGSAPAAAAAGSVLRAGRRALEGAEAAGRQALEDAEDAARTAGTVADEASGQVLREWVGCVRRAYLRNIQAVGDLAQCRTVFGLLQWQNKLLSESAADLAATNARILRLAAHKG